MRRVGNAATTGLGVFGVILAVVLTIAINLGALALGVYVVVWVLQKMGVL